MSDRPTAYRPDRESGAVLLYTILVILGIFASFVLVWAILASQSDNFFGGS